MSSWISLNSIHVEIGEPVKTIIKVSCFWSQKTKPPYSAVNLLHFEIRRISGEFFFTFSSDRGCQDLDSDILRECITIFDFVDSVNSVHFMKLDKGDGAHREGCYTLFAAAIVSSSVYIRSRMVDVNILSLMDFHFD